MAEEVEVVELPTEPTIVEGRVAYEQDVRAAAHRNGSVAHLVGGEVGDPPAPPDEPGDEGRHLPESRPGRTRAITLGSVYLVAGAIAIYIGITMIRESGKEHKRSE